jgi:hypothetical protein
MLAALAVLLIIGGAATAGLLAMRADTRVAVLVAKSDVHVGEAFTQEMLTTASVASDGARLIPASRMSEVVGRHARTQVEAGQLIDTTMITGQSLKRPGEVEVGVLLKPGRMPAGGLQVGDIVQLVGVKEGVGTVLVPQARVADVDVPESTNSGGGDDTVVTLLVGSTDAATVAAVSADDALAAVLVGRGETQEAD